MPLILSGAHPAFRPSIFYLPFDFGLLHNVPPHFILPMSSPFTVPPPAPDPVELKRRQSIIVMRASLIFLVLSAVLILVLPIPLPMPLRLAVAGIDLIAALVIFAIYHQRLKS